MEINGPLKVDVVEPSPDGNRRLHIERSDALKAADLGARGTPCRSYPAEPGTALADGTLTGRDAPGALPMQQICGQSGPHIGNGEIALGETRIIEAQRTPGVNLADLLN